MAFISCRRGENLSSSYVRIIQPVTKRNLALRHIFLLQNIENKDFNIFFKRFDYVYYPMVLVSRGIMASYPVN